MAKAMTVDPEVHPEHIPPVGDEEQLYRRILKGAWFKPGKPKIIPHKAFMPRPWRSPDRPGDPDGISIDRAALTTIEEAATMPHNREKTHLCRFGVSDVLRLNLTVEPKPRPDNPAHSVIPELNSLDCRDPVKERIMEEQAMALRDSAVLIYEAAPS